MDISGMHTAFKMEVDKSTALELPPFEPEEIDFWLNMAIRSFVKTRYRGRQDGVGFEQIAKRTMDLSELVVEETLPTIQNVLVATKENSYIAELDDLSEELWFIVGEEVTIIYIPINYEIQIDDMGVEGPVWVRRKQGVTPCTALNYRSHIDDPYSEHVLHYEEAKPLRLIHQRYVELITDGNYGVEDYSVRYIRKPAEVSITGDVDCDLPEHTHDEIVKLAANMVLENIEQPRYQSHSVELNKVE